MKIYSWNMLFRNEQLDRAFHFIESSDFDIFCLQEVPEKFLNRLRERFPQLTYVREVDRRVTGNIQTHYLVIISKHPILGTTPLPLPAHERPKTVRKKYFVRLMFKLGLWAEGLGNRHNMHADILISGRTVRVYNLHLPLMNPAWRKEEFEHALTDRDHSLDTIVCGDFNILESPHISILNWLLGGRLSDALLFRRERMHIEKRFVEHELHNPLRGISTHPLSQSQLDHILVSYRMEITNSYAISDRYGSDHKPIFVEARAL